MSLFDLFSKSKNQNFQTPKWPLEYDDDDQKKLDYVSKNLNGVSLASLKKDLGFVLDVNQIRYWLIELIDYRTQWSKCNPCWNTKNKKLFDIIVPDVTPSQHQVQNGCPTLNEFLEPQICEVGVKSQNPDMKPSPVTLKRWLKELQQWRLSHEMYKNLSVQVSGNLTSNLPSNVQSRKTNM